MPEVQKGRVTSSDNGVIFLKGPEGVIQLTDSYKAWTTYCLWMSKDDTGSKHS